MKTARNIAMTTIFAVLVFLGSSNYVFKKAFIPEERAWPDLKTADKVQYEILIDAYKIKHENSEEVEIVAADGVRLLGNYYERKKDAPLVIFFHGLWSDGYLNGVPIYRITKQHQWNLLLVTSRAHGESGGEFSTLGIWERYDCRDWANWATKRFGTKTSIFLMGVSTGGATVMMSSNLDLPYSVCGIIDDSGYTSPMEMIVQNSQERLPKFIPVGVFEFIVDEGTKLWGGFNLREMDACKALAQTNIPLLIIHGDKDTLAPISMAYRIYDSCVSEKQLYIVPDADHAETYKANSIKYENIVTEFIEQHLQK